MDSSNQSQASSEQNIVNVESRWTLLPISGIEKVEVIDIKPYTGPVTDKLKPGMLGSADLKIVFSSSTHVEAESLAARVHSSNSLFAKEVRVELGTLSPISQVPCQEESKSQGVIVVPLLRMDGEFPLFDKLPFSGSVMHIKVAIPGVHSSSTGINTCTYYIRLRADYVQLTVEIKSVSRSLFDTSRISEATEKFVKWIKSSVLNLKEKATNTKKSLTNDASTTSQTSAPLPELRSESTPHQN